LLFEVGQVSCGGDGVVAYALLRNELRRRPGGRGWRACGAAGSQVSGSPVDDAGLRTPAVVSAEDDLVSLQFGAPQASNLVSSGDVEFGISESGELVCVAVRRPDVAVPADYPG
jgi:hypothetical protein